MRRILLTLILAIVVLAVPVSPALAQVVSPSTASPSPEPCLYTGPVAAGIFDFVNLTPCEIQVASD